MAQAELFKVIVRGKGLRVIITGSITTHSTGARVSLPFIVNLSVATLCARPVNSGVGRLTQFVRGEKNVIEKNAYP